MAAKLLKKETNIIIDYIRKNAKEKNEWVHITSRDMPKLFSISQIYFTKLIEKIKDHPNILYEADESFPSRFKPYRFRWTEDPQEKIEHGLTYKQFYWLNAKEVEYIKNITAIDKYEELSKILKTCNLLAGDGGKDWWIIINQEELADLTVSVTKETEQRLNFMISKNLLVKAKHGPYYRLVLTPNCLSKVLHEAEQETVPVKPKQERKKRKAPASPEPFFVKNISSTEIISDITDQPKPIVIDKTSKYDTLSNDVLQSDFIPVENNQEVLNINSAIQDVLSAEQSATHVVNKLQTLIHQLDYFQKQEESAARSYHSFQKLLAEYETLRSEHDSLKENLQAADNKNRQLHHKIKLLNEHNEEFTKNAQASLDILLGVMTSILDEHILRPQYERNDVLIKSRLTKTIWSAVSDASDRIVNFKSESKLPPDLR